MFIKTTRDGEIQAEVAGETYPIIKKGEQTVASVDKAIDILTKLKSYEEQISTARAELKGAKKVAAPKTTKAKKGKPPVTEPRVMGSILEGDTPMATQVTMSATDEEIAASMSPCMEIAAEGMGFSYPETPPLFGSRNPEDLLG